MFFLSSVSIHFSFLEVTIQKISKFFDLTGNYNIKYDHMFKNLNSDTKIICSCKSSLPKPTHYFKVFWPLLSASILSIFNLRMNNGYLSVF